MTKVASIVRPPVARTALSSVSEGEYSISPEIVTLADPNGVRAESIRAIRTHVIAQHVQGGRRALAICAPSVDVGCTFVAANLAVALSQVGIKTLLIDGDLRSPGVSALISPSTSNMGLAQCLGAIDAPFSEFIEPEVLPNLSVMHAGSSGVNPQELLGGDRFEALMEACLRDFSMTIIDTPPANTSADARRISSVIGYSLVVARRNRSRLEDVRTLVAELRGDHAQVVGTVLNEA